MMISIAAPGKTNVDTIVPGKEYLLKYPCVDDKCYPYTVTLQPGMYLIKCWGASGSLEKSEFSRGAFTSGIISFSKLQVLYFYLGNNGRLNGPETYNGGGHGSIQGNSGGGATDVRLIADNVDPFKSVISRIMVAAGASGLNRYSDCQVQIAKPSGHGHGGAERGITGYFQYCSYINNITFATGGEQQKGGQSGYCCKKPCVSVTSPVLGFLGKGGNTIHIGYGTGGGGGYFGGGSGSVNNGIVGSGGGGSSYVSGHPNCSAISQQSTNINNISFLGTGRHYSNHIFTQIKMNDGYQKIIEPNGIISNGHTGPGFASIKFISVLSINPFLKINSQLPSLLYSLPLIINT